MLKLMIFQILIEFRNIFKTKGLLTILILGPITYGILYPQPYLTEVVKKVPIAVLDNDLSHQSRQLIRDLDANESISVTQYISTIKEGEELLKQEKIYGFLVIPIRFEAQLTEGKSVSMPFYGDASYILIYNNIGTAVSTVVSAMNSQIGVERKIAQGVDPSVAKNSTLLFSPTMIPLFNPQSGYATYIIPPAFILILHQLLFVGILSYAATYRAQEFRYYDSVNPKTKGSTLFEAFFIVIGKAITYLILYSIFYWIYFLLVTQLYDIPNLASPLTLFPFSLIFIATTTFFSLFFSTFVKKIDTIFLLYVPLSIVFFFFVGVSWPKTLIPEWIIALSHFIPATFSINLSIELSQMGASLSLVSNQLIMLSFLGIFYFLLTLYRFYTLLKREQKTKG